MVYKLAHQILHRDGPKEEGGGGGQNHPHLSGAFSQLSGVVYNSNNHLHGDKKAKSRKNLSNFLSIGLFSSKELAPCMENLHAKEPFHYWQRPCSVSSLLNSSSGRAKNGKVVHLAASTPGRLLRILPQNAAAWVYAPTSLSS